MGYLSCKEESAVSVISSSTTTHNSSSSKAATDKQENPIKIQQFDYCDLEAASKGFSDQRLLGKGSHGAVYKAVLRGCHVAIKRPSSWNQETIQEADNEIEILSNIRSPGLVNILGFSNDAKDRLLVVESISNGTLYDVLHSNSSRPLNWGRRIRLALQVAKALETLHSQKFPIIHRDVKSANVLIDRNFNATLGDFGLALRCCVDDYRLRSTPPVEIISCRKAIDVVHSPPSIVDWAIPLVKKGNIVAVYDPRIAPPKDPIVRKQLAVVAAKCVRSCRERRPAMKEVVGTPKRIRMQSMVHLPPRTHTAYSDLGFRSNLMELMGIPSIDVGEADASSSHRFDNKRYGSQGRS
ncbi:Serine/threonine-protein kinase-like protein [Hibiscus syriacus]|uniref:Serine/threonine-protein kinase-like protein n=1 Tax=Hibiscus syriacus TaxID=106335 RepID=A0A6A2Y649_HIBSY|nr:Serine/threonine-protein kinase-like protein [Hibiscus syriacus]